MLLKTRDGIGCDICSSSYRNDFTYYSFDRLIIVVNGGFSSPPKAIDSCDICESCNTNIMDTCKANLGPIVPMQIKCDACPEYSKGESFSYYRLMVTKVVVDKGKKEEGPSEVVPRYMDFNICYDCGQKWSEKLKKSKEAHGKKGGWS